MTKKNIVLLWQNSRDKAMDKGFQMDLVCPLEKFATGKLVYIFRETAETRAKLGELRRELDNILKVTLHDPKTEDK